MTEDERGPLILPTVERRPSAVPLSARDQRNAALWRVAGTLALTAFTLALAALSLLDGFGSSEPDGSGALWVGAACLSAAALLFGWLSLKRSRGFALTVYLAWLVGTVLLTSRAWLQIEPTLVLLVVALLFGAMLRTGRRHAGAL